MDWVCAGCGGSCPPTFAFCGHCGRARSASGVGVADDVDEVVRALVGDQLRQQLEAQGGRLPEERRLVTAIFADLSGFTPLAGTLDAETLASVVDPLLAGLIRIAQRREGFVGSFAGDALMVHFGAPVTHEDDAERAVRCAHEMLAEFPALLASVPQEGAGLSLRIGIDTGVVLARLIASDTKTDYAVMGNSVNMAQRLQSNAPPGGCVVGETTYRLTRDSFDYEDLGGLTVKGRSTPLPAFLLVAPRERAVQRRDARTPLVGRDVELAAVAAAQEPGPGRGLLLVGEAGAGKSRLLEEARALSERPWFEGGCVPHDALRAYRPWVGVLEGLLARAPGYADLVGVQVVRGSHDASEHRLSPAALRDRVAADLAALLADVAPAVVVVEDLHWADRSSLDLLDDLLHVLPDDVLLVGTSRSAVETTVPVAVLTPQPLAGPEVDALVGRLLGGQVPPVLTEDLAARSGGNPLYLAELATALLDRGLVTVAEGGVLDARGSDLAAALDLVPDSLEGLIGARIDALSSAEERALVIASVLGAPVVPSQVEAVAAQLAEPHHEVAAALDGLHGRGLLSGDRFTHAVVQSTSYLRITRARRRAYHRAAADACTDLIPADQRPGFRARHLYLGAAGPRAITALEAGAADALRRGAHDEAVLHLQRDVELRAGTTATAEQQVALPARLTQLGELLELLGRYADAESTFSAAAEAGAGAVAQRGRVGCLRHLGRYDEAVALADAVLADAAPDEPARARLIEERGWALAAGGDLQRAVDDLGEGWSDLDRARHDLVRGYCWGETGRPDEARQVLEGALTVFLEHDETALAARCLRTLGEVEGASGDLKAAGTSLARGLGLARESGAAEEVAACLSFLTQVAGISGDLDRATAYSREAVLASDRLRQPNGRATSRNNLAYTLHLAGHHAEAIAHASEAVAIAVAAGLPFLRLGALHTRGSALLALGRVGEALVDAEEAVALDLGNDDHDDAVALLAEVRQALQAAAAAVPRPARPRDVEPA